MALLTVASLAVGASSAAADELLKQRGLADEDFARQLNALADRAAAAGAREFSERLRAWNTPRDPLKLYLISLPDAFAVTPERGAASAPDEPAAAAEFEREFTVLRQSQGQRLFELAREAMRAKRAALAYELLLSAAREDPDHEELRKLLGYARYDGRWHTRYEAGRLRAGQVWHPRFGWLPSAHVERYEQGERNYSGRWMTADEESRLRGDIRRAWRIETEHYVIRTNHSLEAGVALGHRLERLYAAWQQVFIRYYATPQQIDRWFEGRGLPRIDDARHLVVYLRDRDEYRRHLAGKIPADLETTGIYLGDQRTAFFFAADPPQGGETAHRSDAKVQTTLYHEAAHQLFSESRPVVPNIGRQANFWIVEGIACYFESLTEHNGHLTLGGADAQRLQAARYRAVEDNFYVPLAEFCQYGMGRLQQDPRIAKLYSQAAGLTHFLIHYDEGRYRDALVAYLLAIYTGRNDPAMLAVATGTSFDELDRQYREFLAGLPALDQPVAETAGR